MAALNASDFSVEKLIEDPLEDRRGGGQAEFRPAEVEAHLLPGDQHAAGLRREIGGLILGYAAPRRQSRRRKGQLERASSKRRHSAPWMPRTFSGMRSSPTPTRTR